MKRRSYGDTLQNNRQTLISNLINIICLLCLYLFIFLQVQDLYSTLTGQKSLSIYLHFVLISVRLFTGILIFINRRPRFISTDNEDTLIVKLQRLMSIIDKTSDFCGFYETFRKICEYPSSTFASSFSRGNNSKRLFNMWSDEPPASFVPPEVITWFFVCLYGPFFLYLTFFQKSKLNLSHVFNYLRY